jgi:AcrR family transcriptional regulator
MSSMRDPIDSLPLRELKKHRTAQTLRATARAYFKRGSFDEAKLANIARDAEVSATTVYNYFATKLELLYAVIREDALEFVARAGKLRERNWDDATEAIVAFARLFFRWLDAYHRSVPQAVVAAALVSRGNEQSEYERLDDLNAAAVTELVVALQEQRLIAPALDARFIGRLLFSLINAEFLAFVADEGRSVEASCTSLRHQLEFIAPAWAPGRARTRRST